MNCQDFQAILVEIARDQSVDQRARKAASAHTHSCPSCATLLGDERALSAGLRRFAEMSRTEKAPPRVEAALSAAFRERMIHQGSPAPVAAFAPVRRWPMWAVAAAAVFLVVLALVAWRSVRMSGQQPQHAESPSSSREERADRKEAPEQPREVAPQQSPVHDRAVRKGSRRRAADLKPYVAGGKQSDRPGASQRRVEIATEFMSLTGANLIPLEGGHVVRVQLPRSALMSFGLPMNMERADERINADVLVGDDGLARAIRFVR